MADELTLGASLFFRKSGVEVAWDAGTFQLDVSGDQAIRHTQSIGTSEEALDIGDLGTPGWMIAVNRDDTNYVTIHNTGESAVVKIKAGEVALFRLGTSAPYATADTAAVLLEYAIIED